MVISKKTTGLPRAMASNTIGSAMVTDIFVTRRGAAGGLQLRRWRSDGVAGQQVCNARLGDRRRRRSDASARRARRGSEAVVPSEGGTPRAATRLAGMDAKVKEATTMASTRPQRLQQAHTQRRTRQPQLNASVLHELASLEFAFAALFAVFQRRDAGV